jgi:hypothetical protein
MDDFTWFSPTDYFYAGCCWCCDVDRHHTTQIFCPTSGGDQLFLANDAGFYAFLVFIANDCLDILGWAFRFSR